jgi:type IV pilus assembly protein PilM
MKKDMLGVDIGSGTIKLVTSESYVVVDTPEDSVKGDTLVTFDGMSEFIHDTLKENGLKAKKVSLVIPDTEVYMKRTTMPYMSQKQLSVNLPYEFKDALGKDKDSYLYDYAIANFVKNDSGKIVDMELLVAAVSNSLIEKYKEMFKKAGLKLTCALPRELAIMNILNKTKDMSGDVAMVDLGYTYTRIDIFNDGVYETSKTLELGVKDMAIIASELLYCDPHIALEYLKVNKDNVLSNEKMINLYENIAVEIMRAINYYTYENRENTLEKLYVYGGGYHIEQFVSTIKANVSLEVEPISSIRQGEDDVLIEALAAYGACEG